MWSSDKRLTLICQSRIMRLIGNPGGNTTKIREFQLAAADNGVSETLWTSTSVFGEATEPNVRDL